MKISFSIYLQDPTQTKSIPQICSFFLQNPIEFWSTYCHLILLVSVLLLLALIYGFDTWISRLITWDTHQNILAENRISNQLETNAVVVVVDVVVNVFYLSLIFQIHLRCFCCCLLCCDVCLGLFVFHVNRNEKSMTR